MTTIVTRAGKGSPLTNTEVDSNFSNLNTDKLELGGTFSSGTANSILYLNGSKVLTTGSALTFDGSTVGAFGGSTVNYRFNANRGTDDTNQGLRFGYAGIDAYRTDQLLSSPSTPITFTQTGSNGTRTAYEINTSGQSVWSVDGSEQMRLTSTGLGIGTSSPAYRVDASGQVRALEGGTGSGNGGFVASTSGANGNAGVLFQTNSASRWNLTTAGTNGVNLRIYNYALGSTVATFDSSGNLGLGVTPSAWSGSYKALQIGARGSLYAHTSVGATLLGENVYDDGTAKYIATAAASRYQLSGGVHYWYTAASGTAGDAISFSQALTLDANRNLLLNGTSAGASAVGTFAIFNGTAPTGSVTDGIILYAEDVSSSSELKVRDEAGNVTTLSPHNFSLIPEGPSEDMAWAYYSEKGGKRINVDMLKLARMVEKLTGEKLVYES